MLSSTAPRPYVFVLMPFAPEFDDVYMLGIKGAADAAGAYAERVDEQIYAEDMLDRIFNQINKADVIVADMTGKNANVFYEVGYAHALGKIVILLTQNADDIPFDLKQRRHIVYAGRITDLKDALTRELQWAIEETRKGVSTPQALRVAINDVDMPEVPAVPTTKDLAPMIQARSGKYRVSISNDSIASAHDITHVYLMMPTDCGIRLIDGDTYVDPVGIRSVSGLNEPLEAYRIGREIRAIPPGAIEACTFTIGVYSTARPQPEGGWPCRLRVHSHGRHFEFSWRFNVE